MKRIQYKELKIYKYELTQTYEIRLAEFKWNLIHTKYFSNYGTGDYLTIRPGYKWDGPSGPTIDTDTFMRGSLVHDVLYQAIREGFLTLGHRKAADLILYRICREDGMSRIRANYVYYGVRAGGRSSAKPSE